MTVIAWDGHTLAADKRTSFGTSAYTTNKLCAIHGMLIGGCGSAGVILEFLDWIRHGSVIDTYPQKMIDDNETEAIVIDHGRILRYGHYPRPTIIEDQFVAIGSGADYARTAMYLGKTAPEAVAVASIFDVGCGNGIDTLTVND